jgi:hypothetical protein
MSYVIEKKSQARRERQIQRRADRRAKKKDRKSAVPWERAHKDRWDAASGRSDDKLANRAARKKRSEQHAKDKQERMRKRGIERKQKPLSTVDLVKVSKHQAKGGLSPRLRMTTPKARAKETELYKSHGAPDVSENRPPAHLNVPLSDEDKKKLALLIKSKKTKKRDPMAQRKLDWRKEDFVTVRGLMGLHRLDEGTSELEKRCVYDVMRKAAKGPDGKSVKGDRARLSRAFAICRASLQKSGRIEKGGMELTKLGGKISGPKARKKDHKTKVAGYEKDLKAARKK